MFWVKIDIIKNPIDTIRMDVLLVKILNPDIS
jgi:hypothetical protein